MLYLSQFVRGESMSYRFHQYKVLSITLGYREVAQIFKR